eukprot:CAMPEP_0113275880 /NCGR_PEP_ID=MMETSP0008_2-20120614/25190_1 /TAXON_ID=97485 /ORGANISM="Prymnesium parvum" /LENGTH=108 /DNA_ID=CAMNT_0000125633 /DNA_START=498 /DNA_END=820 /DNA_ORIENTATION=+ /assembly_acc=CAM_ASM_000153
MRWVRRRQSRAAMPRRSGSSATHGPEAPTARLWTAIDSKRAPNAAAGFLPARSEVPSRPWGAGAVAARVSLRPVARRSTASTASCAPPRAARLQTSPQRRSRPKRRRA